MAGCIKLPWKKILAFDPDKKLPYCITSKRACPPEDCGGTWGYADLLEVLKDPEHGAYTEMLEWLGGEFDPAYVSRRETNQLLLKYCR
ncbi:plasmid pRiA4b ORF-3 family protein [Bathymodiolus japonicus methanotrophic gill symbiont]|uniref:plasmid pRiA4b ORF-3 family protein n=1 Tax=Bathymodiolus japonicus methanotrophic gill symbiont TaxID=113269 RepID=UPI0021E17169|nr:plasmid pRiA4b ORF-3 family protein [Bathymodiolus japonicus methanotrophic gill symbiont]